MQRHSFVGGKPIFQTNLFAMKRTLFLFIALPLLATLQLQAQDGPRNTIKVNVFSPLVRTASVSYEHALNTRHSAQLNVFYSGVSIENTRFRGMGITPEYRFYLSENKEAPAGFYLGPFLRYQNFNLTDKESDNKASLSTFGGGVLLGGQWIFNEKIALDAFIGPSFNAGNINTKGGAEEDDFSTGLLSGPGVRLGVTVGYAF